ncbi:MAG: 50S ribosomal protein L9 [Bacteroidales bacterium]|nr:50S ribosomal protein L9 [Bacteroidales bacterium]
MDIILKQDVSGLGDKDEIVSVKDGYARNYLIPQGYAILATSSAKKIHEENKRQRSHKEEKIRLEADDLAQKLSDVKLTIGAKTSSSGKIFGSVNTIQIAEALKKEGFDIDRKKITIEGDQVKEVGKYKAIVKLHKEVKAEIDFDIIAE